MRVEISGLWLVVGILVSAVRRRELIERIRDIRAVVARSHKEVNQEISLRMCGAVVRAMGASASSSRAAQEGEGDKFR